MKKFSEKRYMFSPEEITRKLTVKAQAAVAEHMPNYICFTRSDIFNIAICMKRVCRDDLKEYYHMLKFAWDVAALDNNGYAVLIVPEEYKAIIMDALVNGANTKDQYQTLKDLMQWFNLRRAEGIKLITGYRKTIGQGFMTTVNTMARNGTK